MKLWRWFLELINSAATPIEPPPQPPQPALWSHSDASPVADELTARQLRSRAKGMVISASTLAARSHLSLERLRDVLLEHTPPAEGELRKVQAGLDRIAQDRRALFALAEEHDLVVGLVF